MWYCIILLYCAAGLPGKYCKFLQQFFFLQCMFKYEYMIHFGALDFRECRSEKVICFF